MVPPTKIHNRGVNAWLEQMLLTLLIASFIFPVSIFHPSHARADEQGNRADIKLDKPPEVTLPAGSNGTLQTNGNGVSVPELQGPFLPPSTPSNGKAPATPTNNNVPNTSVVDPATLGNCKADLSRFQNNDPMPTEAVEYQATTMDRLQDRIQQVRDQLRLRLPRTWQDWSPRQKALLTELGTHIEKATALAMMTNLETQVDVLSIPSEEAKKPERFEAGSEELQNRFETLKLLAAELAAIQKVWHKFKAVMLEEMQINVRPKGQSALSSLLACIDMLSAMKFRYNGLDAESQELLESSSSLAALIGQVPYQLELFLVTIDRYFSAEFSLFSWLRDRDALPMNREKDQHGDRTQEQLDISKFKEAIRKLSLDTSIPEEARRRCEVLYRLLDQHWDEFVELGSIEASQRMTKRVRRLLKSKGFRSPEYWIVVQHDIKQARHFTYMQFRMAFSFIFARMVADAILSLGPIPHAFPNFVAQFKSMYGVAGLVGSLLAFGVIHIGWDYVLFKNRLMRSMWGREVVRSTEAWHRTINRSKVIKQINRTAPTPEARAAKLKELAELPKLTKGRFFTAAFHHALPLGLTMATIDVMFSVLQHPKAGEALFLLENGFEEEGWRLVNRILGGVFNRFMLTRVAVVAALFTLGHVLFHGLGFAIATVFGVTLPFWGTIAFILILIGETLLTHDWFARLGGRWQLRSQVHRSIESYETATNELLGNPKHVVETMDAMTAEIDEAAGLAGSGSGLTTLVQDNRRRFLSEVLRGTSETYLRDTFEKRGAYAAAPVDLSDLNIFGDPAATYTDKFLKTDAFEDFLAVDRAIDRQMRLLSQDEEKRALLPGFAAEDNAKHYPKTAEFFELVRPLSVHGDMLATNYALYRQFALAKLFEAEKKLDDEQRRLFNTWQARNSSIFAFLKNPEQLLMGLIYVLNPHAGNLFDSAVERNNPEAIRYLRGQNPNRFFTSSPCPQQSPMQALEGTRLYKLITSKDDVAIYRLRRLAVELRTDDPEALTTEQSDSKDGGKKKPTEDEKILSEATAALKLHLEESFYEYAGPELQAAYDERQIAYQEAIDSARNELTDDDVVFIQDILRSDICQQLEIDRKKHDSDLGVDQDAFDAHCLDILQPTATTMGWNRPPETELAILLHATPPGWFFHHSWVKLFRLQMSHLWKLAWATSPMHYMRYLGQSPLPFVTDADNSAATGLQREMQETNAIFSAVTRLHRYHLHTLYVGFNSRRFGLDWADKHMEQKNLGKPNDVITAKDGEKPKLAPSQKTEGARFIHEAIQKVDPFGHSSWFRQHRIQSNDEETKAIYESFGELFLNSDNDQLREAIEQLMENTEVLPIEPQPLPPIEEDGEQP